MSDVSIGTVSGVIHGRASVSPGIRTRVLEAIESLGYVPNTAAQSMRLGSTNSIGLIVSHINAPFMAEMVSAAQDVFHASGYATLMGSHGGSAERQIQLIKLLHQRKIDALLINHQPESSEEIEALLKATGVPLVLIDREFPTWADAVTVDHKGASRRVTDYLIQLGHRRIGAVLGGSDLSPIRNRLLGYEAAHEAAGLAIDPRLVEGEYSHAEGGYVHTLELCAMDTPPTAIIAGGMSLPGVLRALNQLGLRIPEDISLVVTSRSDLAELMTPSLSFQRWDAGAVGQTAATIALDRIRNGSDGLPKRITIPAEFIVRDSCAAPSSVAMVA